MSRYTDALSAFIAAEREHECFKATAELYEADPLPTLEEATDAAAQRLAQAGDVLERELRQMMREEARGQQVRFETYGADE